jgi:hypothetical protein
VRYRKNVQHEGVHAVTDLIAAHAPGYGW